MSSARAGRPATARVANVGLWVLLAAVYALSAASPPPASSLS
jgi:hypothetical protein